MRRTLLCVATALLLIGVPACADSGKKTAGPTATTSSGGEAVQITTVAPLEKVVSDLAAAFTDAQPEVDVKVTVADGKDSVRAAMETADIVIAPRPWLGESVDGEVTSFARIDAVIAVPDGNPAALDINAFRPGTDHRTLVCGKQTPIGNFSVAVLRLNGIEPDPATVKPDCEAEALQKIADGALDAALVFRNGLSVPPGVELLELPEDRNIVIHVSTASVASSGAAQAFTWFLQSERSRSILEGQSYVR